MKVEIIAIGDELLIGQTIDTNSAWIGENLNALSFEMYQISKIKDDSNLIIEALKLAETRSEIIILTGGLGPTKDDITKTTLCTYFNTELVENIEALENVKRIFKQNNRDLLSVNRDQALLPKSCECILNMCGTASGMWFEKGNKTFISMPGVPFEMKSMMESIVIPKLIEKYNPIKKYSKTILTEGIVESILAKQLEQWEDDLRLKGMELAYLPSPGQIRLRITSRYENDLEHKIKELEDLIPEYIYGEGKQKLSELVGDLLLKYNYTLSTAESCTGGYIAHKITSIPGSSSYYTGSVVSYSNEVKEKILGVKKETLIQFGAVSKEVVEQMAFGVLDKLASNYAISTSGIAGPSGGTKEKPVGTVWIAVASQNKVISEQFYMGDNRERTIQKTGIKAFSMLRKLIIEENEN